MYRFYGEEMSGSKKAGKTLALSSDVQKNRGHEFLFSCMSAYPCIVPSKVSSMYAWLVFVSLIS